MFGLNKDAVRSDGHADDGTRLPRDSSEVVISGVTSQPGTVSSWNLYAAELEWFMHLSFLICWNKVSTFLFRRTSQVCRDGRGKDGVNVLEEKSKVNQSVCPAAVPFFLSSSILSGKKKKSPGAPLGDHHVVVRLESFWPSTECSSAHSYILSTEKEVKEVN